MAAELEGWVYVVGACVLFLGHKYLLRLRDRVADETAADPLADAIDDADREPPTRGGAGTDGDAVVDVFGGQTTAASDMTMTTDAGREFTGAELQAVERAREHAHANPDANPRQLVAAAAAPTNSVPPERVDAYWRDVVRPGLAAFSDVDVDRIEANDGSDHAVAGETDGIDRDATAADATGAEQGEDSLVDDADHRPRGDERSVGETGRPPGALESGTLAAERNDDESNSATATGADSGSPLALDGEFELAWVDRDDEHLRVAGRDHAATFDVVDRDGALAVRPLDGDYRRDDHGDWYVDAATAIEDVLPDAYADLDAPESPWTNAAVDALDVATSSDSDDAENEDAEDAGTDDEPGDATAGERVDVADGSATEN